MPQPRSVATPQAGPTLSKAVIRAAEKLGFNQTALADTIGISRATASRLNSGGYVLDPGKKKEWELALLFVRLFRSLDAILGQGEQARQWLENDTMFADVILMPVCGSAFDRESAADCHAELMALPRVANGKCKLACIGMRLDTRTRAPQVLQEWAAGLGLPFLGVLRESQTYVQCLERGMTLFDLPAERVPTDLRQWKPILDWLQPLLAVAPAAAASALGHHAPATANRPAPAPAAPLPGRLLATRTTPAAGAPRPPAVSPAMTTSQPARPAPVAITPAPAVARVLATRPVPTVTRLSNPNPRVLDRVVTHNGLRAMPSPQAPAPRAPDTAQGGEAPPIPSFLKLVKC